jgi:septal ring factor EnvC (AmiA/AmiB activator)
VNSYNKDEIYSYHHGAIQELNKNLSMERIKTDSLESKVTELENENNELKSQLQSILDRLNALENS